MPLHKFTNLSAIIIAAWIASMCCPVFGKVDSSGVEVVAAGLESQIGQHEIRGVAV